MTADVAPAVPTSAKQLDRDQSFRYLLLGVLHIAGLSALAVAQPLFDLLGRNAEFFVARGSQPVDVWVMTFALIFVPPAVALLLESIAWTVNVKLQRLVHLVIVGALAGAIILQVLVRLVSINGWVLIGLGVAGGVGVALLYDRTAGLRSFLTWLAPAPIIVAALFLFFTPVSRIALPGDVAIAGVGQVADTPVVLIVWDEFSSFGIATADGSIDARNYPNFARLAQDSTWFQRASGVSDASSLAVPAIVTGEFPDPDLLPIAQDHPQSLFTVLAESHSVYAREPVTALCPAAVCEDVEGRVQLGFASRMRALVSDLRVVYLHVLLPADLTGWLPRIDRVWSNFDENAADVEGEFPPVGATPEDFEDLRANEYIREELSGDRVGSVESFIDGLPSDFDKPPFVFLHAALPHAPYRYAPSGLQYRDSGELFGLSNGLWEDDEWAVMQGEQRYLMQTVVVDRLLGDLLDWLESSGIYDEALVIVTADHGVGFTPGEYTRNATPENFGETMSVPMFVKLPANGTGSVSDGDVRTTDIYPTVLDVLGVDAVDSIESRSMLSQPIDRGNKAQMRTDGRIVESDPSMPAWDSGLAAKTRRFASRDGGVDLFQPGASALVGELLSTISLADAVGGSAVVNGLGFIEVPRSAPGFSPIHVTGAIDVGRSHDSDVAIAINGRVAVVGPLLEANSFGGRFSYFLPEYVFDPEFNTVSVFLVEDGVLVPLDLQATKVYSVSTYADGNEYLEIDGVGIPITSRISGGVDVFELRGVAYSLAGWAADTVSAQPADEIVVIVDGISVLVAPPNLPRPDVADSLGDDVYLRSGFSYEMAVEVIERAGSVRVFAVVGTDAATELRLPEGAP